MTTKILIPFLFLLFFTLGNTTKLSHTQTNAWRFPLGDDTYHFIIHQHTKYKTMVENTAYGIRNLDLILGGEDRITCFGVGGQRLYHAGVDLYPIGKDSNQDTPDKANVYAIADGTVKYVGQSYPGTVFIIEHQDSLDNSPIYALYGHLDNPTSLTENDFVNKNDILGTVLLQPHTGNFPEFHPDDDSHLHFEIRTFADAGTIGLPTDCQVGEFGPGYTYPALPHTYGYLGPIAFINQHIPKPHQQHLPLVQKEKRTEITPACQNEDNLLDNIDFETGLDPAPWLAISSVTPDFVQDVTVFEGDYSAQLGNWPVRQVVDDEFMQSFQIPLETSEAAITFKLNIASADNHLSINDVLHITLNNRQTNLNLLSNGGWRYDNRYADAEVWYDVTLPLSGLHLIEGDFVTLSFSVISDDNGFETAFTLDNILFTISCNP